MSKKVQILMSTYNGKKYIGKQIDSILNQDYSNIELLIRDDGSTDGTTEVIATYAQRNKNIKYYVGENLGACKSFFDLLQKADGKADYYAFADQDDYWLPNKITRAIYKLEEEREQQFLLYASEPTIVNEKLQKIKTKKIREIRPSFGNALIENICIGCSVVINNSLYQLISNKIPLNVYMHDWWLYIVASCFGKVIYDTESYFLYRQHSNNVIGMNDSWMSHWKKRALNYGNMKKFRKQQVSELKRWYNISGDRRMLIEDLVKTNSSLAMRIKVLTDGKVYRQKIVDDIIFKILILTTGF